MHLEILMAAAREIGAVLQPSTIDSRLKLTLTALATQQYTGRVSCEVCDARPVGDLPGPDLWLVIGSDTDHTMFADQLITRLRIETPQLCGFSIRVWMGPGYTGDQRDGRADSHTT